MISPEPFGQEPDLNVLSAGTGASEDPLAAYTGTVTWSYLRPHCENGSLHFVDPSLSLTEVGAAMARNDTVRIAAWLKSGDLVRLGPLHAAQWEHDAPEFEALVVSPFVLCRPVSG